MTNRTGPFEEGRWPERLKALAIEAGPRPRLFGYDIEGDLAAHYSAAEVMFLGLTGEPPPAAIGKAFELALVFASACPVNEAPTHAAVLSRNFGAPIQSAIATGTIIASDASRAEVEGHREFLDWLANERQGELPACARPRRDSEGDAVERLRRSLQAIDAGIDLPSGIGRTAAILLALWSCGLESMEQLTAALTWARMMAIVAESLAAHRGGVTGFPALLPPFHYQGPKP